jgi:thiol-disulfide isomerase/thioredoxin
MSQPVVFDVVCLCAEWCGTCREYRETFAALQAELPGHRYRWIDIEDEADAIGDIDIETFPTLLLAWQGQVIFAGPVLPRLGDAQRLMAVQLAQVADGRVPALTALGLPAEQAEAFAELARRLPL